MKMLGRNQCPYEECGNYYANMYDLIHHIEETHIPEIEKLESEKHENESNGNGDTQKEGNENSTPSSLPQDSLMKAPSSAPIPLSLLCRLKPYPKGKVVTPIKYTPRTVSFNYYKRKDPSPPMTPRDISPKRPAIRTMGRPDEFGHMIQTEMQEDHRKFRCTVEGCKKGYKNLQGLKNHMRTSHQAQTVGLTPSEESILSRVPLPDPASLAASPIRVTKYQCQHCPKSYKTMANLHKHVQDTHPRFAPGANLQTPLITMSPIRPQSPMTQNPPISETSTPQMTIVSKQLPHGVTQSPSRIGPTHLTQAGTLNQFQQQAARAASPMQQQVQQQSQVQPQQQQPSYQQGVHQAANLSVQSPQHPLPSTPSRVYQTHHVQQQPQHQQPQQTQPQYPQTQYVQGAYSQHSHQQGQQQQQPVSQAVTYAQVHPSSYAQQQQQQPQQTYTVQTQPQVVQYSQASPAVTQQQQQHPTTTVQTYVAQTRQQPQIVHHRVQQIQNQDPGQQGPQVQQQTTPISITQLRQSPQQRQFIAGSGTTSVRVTTLSPFTAQQQTTGGQLQQQNPTIAQQLQAVQSQQQQPVQPSQHGQQPQQTMTYQYQQAPTSVARGATQMHVRYTTQQPMSQTSSIGQSQQQQQQQQYSTGPTTHTIQIATAGTTGSSTPNTYTHTQFVRSAATGGAIQLQTVSASGTTGHVQTGQPTGQTQMRMVPAGSGNYRRMGGTLTGYQLQTGHQLQQGQAMPRGTHQTTRFYTSNPQYQPAQRSVRLTSISSLQQQQSQAQQPGQGAQQPTVNSIQLRQQPTSQSSNNSGQTR